MIQKSSRTAAEYAFCLKNNFRIDIEIESNRNDSRMMIGLLTTHDLSYLTLRTPAEHAFFKKIFFELTSKPNQIEHIDHRRQQMPPLQPPSHRHHPYICLHRLPSHPHRTAAAYLLAFVWLTKLNENETKRYGTKRKRHGKETNKTERNENETKPNQTETKRNKTKRNATKRQN